MEGAPKWFLKSKTFWGIVVMLAATLLGNDGVLNVPYITDFLSGLGETGTVTVGAILALIGNGLRNQKITLWKP